MENDHEKIEILNYDSRVHSESTIQKRMVPGVQKCIFFFSIAPYAEKYKSEGAESGPPT